MSMTLDELHAFVISADEFDLELIEAAVRFRKEQIGSTKSPEAVNNSGRMLGEYRVGDIVRFNTKARPQYLNGLTATITKVNQKSVILSTPDDPKYRRFQNIVKIRTPKSIVELV